MAFSIVAPVWRLRMLVSLLVITFVTGLVAGTSHHQDGQGDAQTNYKFDIHDGSQSPLQASPEDSPSTPQGNTPANHSLTKTNILQDLYSALSTMQDHYFAIWLGKYTTAIDWTGAVTSTYVSATLSTLSSTLPSTFSRTRKHEMEALVRENEINKYFSQTTAYYFGEDHFAIRMQAYDDMLWVVLGWLEASRFIETHSSSHHSASSSNSDKSWHAHQFIPAFAHRARIFYELAEKGWDWRLCGGGMTWNPSLLPYKNAITNQLFISASISMYLHFPGDQNCSPFFSQSPSLSSNNRSNTVASQDADDDDGCLDNPHTRPRYSLIYLANAINGYTWLQQSGMQNAQGLYTDGFHITGYRTNHSKTVCDDRNEMVYTYNQGVVLSGLRGLWEATGKTQYLEDGHELVRNVIRATGWDISSSSPSSPPKPKGKEEETKWHGLGSNGILTELCDPIAHCNQDAQTFKGILFHHLTAFCDPLPRKPAQRGKTHSASRALAALHHNSCKAYTGWVVHNAQAALATRDREGRFGGWWGANEGEREGCEVEVGVNATDYRNGDTGEGEEGDVYGKREKVQFMERRVGGDLNDRGRGRTVETQGSGLAVVRAMWIFLWRDEFGVVE
ncbi:glycoside hydrolase family 76 protein [Bipolaris zeicola 26-R-13]|uniref:Glycoside hydrolase family 76 protein n=1 Tax=Cochliobolus carbonum (strain 26-R-13) TaxID=930089 RepID=W6Y908_COCC2|nr:glycoside hydrolase family 76 protein [Bipolaris zeicola 26-R-13]EUC36097.1 glycoside hydrolase family 76 protein [Bipolaris zeicola 26-R-13]